MDPRTKRGLAVHDLIRRLPPGPQREAAERGLQLLRQGQAAGTLSPDLDTAIRQASAIKADVDRRFLEQEHQTSLEREVVRFGAGLSDANLQTIDAIHQQGGWQAVRSALTPYLSTGALEVLENTYADSGGNLAEVGERVRGRIAEEAAEEHAAATRQAVQEKWNPEKAQDRATKTILERSAVAKMVRDPRMQELAARWWAAHAGAANAAGIGLKVGQDPVEALVSVAKLMGRDGSEGADIANDSAPSLRGRWGPDQALAEFAAAIGEKDMKGLRGILGAVNDGLDHHELVSRIAKGSQEERQHRASRAQAPIRDGQAIAAKPTSGKRDSTRAALEKASRRLGEPDESQEPYLANSSMAVSMAARAGLNVKASTPEAKRFVEKVTAEDRSPAPDSSSIREALERNDTNDGGTDDDE